MPERILIIKSKNSLKNKSTFRINLMNINYLRRIDRKFKNKFMGTWNEGNNS